MKKNEIIETKVENLIMQKNSLFPLYNGDRLIDMFESIKKFGVLTPIIVTKENNKFYVVDGNNRVECARKLKIETLNALVMTNLTEEQKTLLTIETNLMQRSFSDLKHSQKAKILSLRNSILKKQGYRTDLFVDETLSQIGIRSSYEDLNKEYGLSRNSIARYIRVDKLIEILKDLLDNGVIPLNAGVELSYLKNESQEMVHAIITEDSRFKVDIEKSKILRKLDSESKLTWFCAKDVLRGTLRWGKIKENKIEIDQLFLTKYFQIENLSKSEIEEIIKKAIEKYFEKN